MPALTIPVHGATIEWSDDDTTYAAIPRPKNVIIPEVSRDFRDVTGLDNTSGYRDWAAGLKDGGEITLETFYTPDGYETAAAKAALDAVVYIKVTLPASPAQSAGDEFLFTAFVTPAVSGDGVEGDMMLNLNLRTSGAVTWTKGAAAV